MKRILKFLLIIIPFLFIDKVSALSNLEAFSNLTISENGKFYNLTPNGISNSLGYKLIKSDPFYYSLPSSDMMLGPSYGAEGLAFTQCDLNFEKDVYYTMNYYFLDSANAYIYPSYSKYPYKMGIHANVDGPVLNFNGDWYSGSISVETQASLSLLHSFTISFKAPNNGACITTALNTKKNTNLYQYAFIGYTIKNFGFKAPSTADIKKDLEGSFNQINSNLKGIEDHLNSNINASTNVIMGNIDDMQAQATKEHKEAEETRKGIWGTIKSIFSSIIELPKNITTLLIDGLINMLKSLFVPSDAQLKEIVDDSVELSENFGFVGQSINFFINIFTSLLGLVNYNGCIILPEFTIGESSLFDSHTFWNEQQVCLADNTILSNNIDTIRTATSIALVCLFVNFASGKFFSILSKNDNWDASNDAMSIRGGK